jgi:hypothetical protein
MPTTSTSSSRRMLENVLSQLVSTFATFSIVAILYCNYILFEAYATPILWSVITSQTLKPAKNKIIDFLNDVSDTTNVQEHMLSRAFRRLKRGWFRRIRTSGTLGVFFDHSLVMFVLICAISISLRVFTFHVVAIVLVTLSVPTILAIYLLDRNVFAYRHIISDDTLASIVVVCFFFFTVSFVFFSLTFEATMEFLQAAQIFIQRVTLSIEEDDVTREQWTKMVASLQSAVETQVGEFRNIYNETAWFPFVESSIQRIQIGFFNSSSIANISDTAMMSADDQAAFTTLEIPSFNTLYGQFHEMLEHKDVLMNAFQHAHTAIAVIALRPLLSFVSLASMALQLVFKSLVFFTLLMSLLAGKSDVLTKLFEMIPLGETQRGLDALRSSLEACFFLPFRVASSHAMIAILTFHLFGKFPPFFFFWGGGFIYITLLNTNRCTPSISWYPNCIYGIVAPDCPSKCDLYSVDCESSSERTYYCWCVSFHYATASFQSGTVVSFAYYYLNINLLSCPLQPIRSTHTITLVYPLIRTLVVWHFSLDLLYLVFKGYCSDHSCFA